MANLRPTPASIDDYIAAFPSDVQAILQQVRQATREAAPQADEVISYQMPALRLNGILVYFAAFKKHIGFYPPITGDARLEKAAAKYAGEKGNLRFPLDAPMPLELIKGLTALRLQQDLAHAADKAAARQNKKRGSPAAPARQRSGGAA
jgi:uncharacterized protein YdhG (YjbR/CyaY superfamily)